MTPPLKFAKIKVRGGGGMKKLITGIEIIL